MLHFNLCGPHAAKVTTLAQAAARRRAALAAVAASRESARMADHERAEAAKAAISPEMVAEADRERNVRSMIGPGPSPSELKYRARKDEHSPLLAPAKLTKDTGRGAPEKTFTGALKLGPTYSPAPHDTRSTKSDRLFVGAGRVVSGQTRQVTYAAKTVFAKRAGTGSVAYQSQCRMMAAWPCRIKTIDAPRLAPKSEPRTFKSRPLPDSVTAWRPLTVDGRKRRR